MCTGDETHPFCYVVGHWTIFDIPNAAISLIVFWVGLANMSDNFGWAASMSTWMILYAGVAICFLTARMMAIMWKFTKDKTFKWSFCLASNKQIHVVTVVTAVRTILMTPFVVLFTLGYVIEIVNDIDMPGYVYAGIVVTIMEVVALCCHVACIVMNLVRTS